MSFFSLSLSLCLHFISLINECFNVNDKSLFYLSTLLNFSCHLIIFRTKALTFSHAWYGRERCSSLICGPTWLSFQFYSQSKEAQHITSQHKDLWRSCLELIPNELIAFGIRCQGFDGIITFLEEEWSGWLERVGIYFQGPNVRGHIIIPLSEKWLRNFTSGSFFVIEIMRLLANVDWELF